MWGWDPKGHKVNLRGYTMITFLLQLIQLPFLQSFFMCSVVLKSEKGKSLHMLTGCTYATCEMRFHVDLRYQRPKNPQ